jgi:hypothetical protein
MKLSFRDGPPNCIESVSAAKTPIVSAKRLRALLPGCTVRAKASETLLHKYTLTFPIVFRNVAGELGISASVICSSLCELRIPSSVICSSLFLTDVSLTVIAGPQV